MKNTQITEWKYPILRYLTTWFLLIIVALSFVHFKKSRYILAIIPAISLLAGYIFVDPDLAKIKQFCLKFCRILPLIGLMIVLGMVIYHQYFIIAALFFIIILLLQFLIKNELMIFILGILTLIIFSVWLYYPLNLHAGMLHGAKPILLSYWPW